MVAVNIFDPIVIIVIIYTVLITLIGLFNNPYPSSFLLLITLFVVTSYIYYKVDKNEPVLTPTYETETMPSVTMPLVAMPLVAMPSEAMPSVTMPSGPITTLPVI